MDLNAAARPVDRASTRRTFTRAVLGVSVVVALAVLAGPTAAQTTFITVASTTSTEQSGLFGHLLPQFKAATGIEVRVVALGTGQALDMGRRGDADVVFVHDQPAEEKFVAEGWSLKRVPVMYNDFVLVGPSADPAQVRGKDIVASLRKLGASPATFISRGDKSGTHTAELRYWKQAGTDVASAKLAGYKECGCGMGPALNMASSTEAYTLSDRGTWLSFKNRGSLTVLVEGDTRLFNQYGVMLVNPAKHPHVKQAAGQTFVDWVVSPVGQASIAAYQIGGEQLFFPNAAR